MLIIGIVSIYLSILSVSYRIVGIVCLFDIDVAPSISYFDIEGVRYRRSHFSMSKVTKGQIDIEVRYRPQSLRYRIMISYTISKAFFTFDIEYKSFDIVQQNIGIDIVYDIALTQCHSLRSGSSLCPGGFTPAPKSLSATRPGVLHPLLAEFHSLIHRDLTRKRPSIAPHPHVDFEQPALSPVVGS